MALSVPLETVTLTAEIGEEEHLKTTAKCMADRRDRGTDLVLQLLDRRWQVHAAPLAAHSQFAAAMLWSASTGTRQPSVLVLDELVERCVTPEGLSLALDFVYEGRLRLRPADVFHALSTAIALEMPGLLHLVGLYLINLAKEPAVAMYALELAVHNQIGSGLRQQVLQSVGVDFDRVAIRPEFVHASIEAVHTLLSCVYLNTESEMAVFEAIVNWMVENGDDADSVHRLLACVRVDRLSEQQRIACVCLARNKGLTALADEAQLLLLPDESVLQLPPVTHPSTIHLPPLPASSGIYKLRLRLLRDRSTAICGPIRIHLDLND